MNSRAVCHAFRSTEQKRSHSHAVANHPDEWVGVWMAVENRVETAVNDPEPGTLEPRGVGRSSVRDQRHQQRRGRHVPPRPVRRRRRLDRSSNAHLCAKRAAKAPQAPRGRGRVVGNQQIQMVPSYCGRWAKPGSISLIPTTRPILTERSEPPRPTTSPTPGSRSRRRSPSRSSWRLWGMPQPMNFSVLLAPGTLPPGVVGTRAVPVSPGYCRSVRKVSMVSSRGPPQMDFRTPTTSVIRLRARLSSMTCQRT